MEEVKTDALWFKLETLLRFPRGRRSKFGDHRQTAQELFAHDDLRASRSLPENVYTMMNCLLTIDTSCTLLTQIHITAFRVFLYNPDRWSPAVRFVIVKAKDSLNNTDNATVGLNEPDGKTAHE